MTNGDAFFQESHIYEPLVLLRRAMRSCTSPALA
jgi:hypothetical protein